MHQCSGASRRLWRRSAHHWRQAAEKPTLTKHCCSVHMPQKAPDRGQGNQPSRPVQGPGRYAETERRRLGQPSELK
eukprot:CAMPEP_0206442976 /NCGR_PEP_ID=MMETSP0324_2-20121206/14115_1 /ASSEMBLY_ACC=CAM_ASM_000836 /TAXON_ID=2866 /ORGANISM="Crypthecodinium cohnii, Strain Seligo" /LENGTH=75 /DNA_ID=CAMNT_0053910867 /DNA_START=322 /DNA_END=549 /DNA_ORIENTATION=+